MIGQNLLFFFSLQICLILNTPIFAFLCFSWDQNKRNMYSFIENVYIKIKLLPTWSISSGLVKPHPFLRYASRTSSHELQHSWSVCKHQKNKLRNISTERCPIRIQGFLFTVSAPKHEPQYVSLCSSLPPCLCKGLSICRGWKAVSVYTIITYK